MGYILAALFALTPTYRIRFELAGIPLNLLEILVIVFIGSFIFWIARTKQLKSFMKFITDQPKIFILGAGLFIVAGLLSTLISPDLRHAAGMYLTLILMPIMCFFPAKYILKSDRNKEIFLTTITLVILIASAYAVVQYFTLIGLPESWWGNSAEPKRAISFLSHPNKFALWLTPLLALLLPYLLKQDSGRKKALLYLTQIFGITALILSGTRGGWLGLLAAIAVFTLLSKNKKVLTAAILFAIVGAITIAATPNLRYRVILPFKGEKSTVSRFSLWHTANKMIEDSPILGKGLYGYQGNFEKYNTDPGLSPINHPHNIFLTLWVETGLLGLISFLIIGIYSAWIAFKNRTSPIKMGLLLFLIAFFVHGLADSPYIINDLALVYWLVTALGLSDQSV